VSISSPADGATLPANSTISVVAKATDNVALAKVELNWSYNGGKWSCDAPPKGITCTTSGDTRTWSFLVGTGSRTFSITATDTSGNATTTAARTIALGDATPPPPPPPTGLPTVTVTQPAAGSAVAPGATLAVRANATDDVQVSQVRLVWVYPTGSQSYNLTNLGSNVWGVDLRLSATAVAGQRTLRVTATDNQGNATTAPDVVINVVP
jgi:hypothetical protein